MELWPCLCWLRSKWTFQRELTDKPRSNVEPLKKFNLHPEGSHFTARCEHEALWTFLQSRRLFGNRPAQRSQSVSHKRASVRPEVRKLLNSPINPEGRSERPFPHLSHTLYVVCAQSATTSKQWEGRGRQGVVPPLPLWLMVKLKTRSSPDLFLVLLEDALKEEEVFWSLGVQMGLTTDCCRCRRSDLTAAVTAGHMWINLSLTRNPEQNLWLRGQHRPPPDH